MPYKNPSYEKYDRILNRAHHTLFENPKLNWLRWLLILPAACFSFSLPFLFFAIVNIVYEPAEWFKNYAEGIPADFIGLIFYVLAGTYFAPNYKRAVALILMLIVILIAGAGILIILINKSYLNLLFVAAGIGGCTVGYLTVLDHSTHSQNSEITGAIKGNPKI